MAQKREREREEKRPHRLPVPLLKSAGAEAAGAGRQVES